MDTDQQFLTPKEVAGILGVHPKTIHQWLRTGRLPGTKISYRAWRIPRSALEQFIVQSSNRPSQQGKQLPQGIQDNLTTASSDMQTSVQSDPNETDPAVKMKHYIRDIMGEDTPEHRRV